MPYLYLHGFASGPRSTKAQVLKRQFQQLNLDLVVLDLNQSDFLGLTLSRQIRQVQEFMANSSEPWGIIGSSLGGLTAAWLAAEENRAKSIRGLVLLAPAFQFLDQWLPRLGPAQLREWCENKTLLIYHHGEQRFLPLAFDFIRDAESYDDGELQFLVPTLILHGRQDEVIDIQVSRTMVSHHAQVELLELDSNHALTDVQDEIWEAIRRFFRL